MFADSLLKQIVCILLVLSSSWSSVLAQRDDSTPLILGSIENEAGEPVANAEVWLAGWVGGFDGDPKILSKTTSDSTGDFAFAELPDSDNLFRNPGQLTVWAKHSTDGIGWFNELYQRKPLKLKLKPIKQFSGQLVGAMGKPIVGAKIVPLRLMTLPFNEANRNVGRFSNSTRSQLATTTDDEGKFEISGLPNAGSLTCEVEATGFQDLSVSWNLPAPIVTRLDSGLSFSGQVLTPAGIKIPDGDGVELGSLTFSGYRFHQLNGEIVEDATSAAYLINNSYTTAISDNAKFQLDKIAPGKYRISSQFAADVPLLLPNGIEYEVKPNKSVPNKAVDDCKLKAVQAFKINGRVLGSIEREPVSAADVHVMHVLDGSLRDRKRVTTDKDGKYVAYVMQGAYMLKVVNAPKAYVPTGDSNGSELGRTRMPSTLR